MSKKFLGSQKLDLPAAEIFRKFLGTPQDRADIARYAVRDTELPLQLIAKLSVWENLMEMANAVNVPMDYLLNRGQQIKVFSAILGKARAMGYVIPDNKAIGLPEGAKYEGATVLEANRGAYFDVVSGLDFASLVGAIFGILGMRSLWCFFCVACAFAFAFFESARAAASNTSSSSIGRDVLAMILGSGMGLAGAGSALNRSVDNERHNAKMQAHAMRATNVPFTMLCLSSLTFFWHAVPLHHSGP